MIMLQLSPKKFKLCFLLTNKTKPFITLKYNYAANKITKQNFIY